jgi:hypothetical protein
VSTNFDLAPPATIVDGLQAVPIDIQSITARLTFDGASVSGSADVTMAFVTGPVDGHPVFDLRQTIGSAWLDGAPLAPAQLAEHDFGGGTSAQLRIVEVLLPAGTTHTLRLTYDLGPPQAPTIGSYLPAMTWSAGPRLHFNFGFTDLAPGRYLEAWIPANLIFDQFALSLELQVVGTAVDHTLISNGAVTSMGTNHWSVAFPARFTALSPMLELRATDALAGANGTVLLPVSANTVTIEAWKPAGSTVSLAAQIANLQTWLAGNETAVGPYAHGNRFVAYLDVGGMEYDGGTTTATSALQHETFHSWWARGVKPASQDDGWFDEAWTVFNVDSPSVPLPFDFHAPPVTLCPRNPWVRNSALAAYSLGYRFFEGIAALLGGGPLKSQLVAFYPKHLARPFRTPELEEFLVARTGNADVVDAFHRFVYGFDDPTPAPDLWLHDAPGDPGSDFWPGTFWDSPDLWVRNADDDGTTHQAAEYGQDNWLYARVINRHASAVARHFVVCFNVKTFAGIQFRYPADFLPCTAAAAGFDLGPGQSTIVKARWPAADVPPAGTHACLLAAVLTRSEHPAPGAHMWEHNNLAQKNLTIVDLAPDASYLLPFVVPAQPIKRGRRYDIELVRPERYPALRASLVHTTGRLFTDRARRRQPAGDRVAMAPDVPDARDTLRDCGVFTGAAPRRSTALDHFQDAPEVDYPPGHVSRVTVALKPKESALLALRLQVPADAKRGDVLRLDLVQRAAGAKPIMGGLALEIHVK